MHGIEEVVVCPGSRNAPIIHALSLNKDIKLYSIVDERSAGFFAIGRSLASQKPVAVCCTSGSAGLNLAPALAEAYYQEIPILAITADRPIEWIDQWDGQTIKQTNFLATTVKKSLEFPNSSHSPETLDWLQQRLVNEAILTLKSDKKGPVHLNVPISEPFYPEIGEDISFPEKINKIELIETDQTPNQTILEFLETHYQENQKIILSIGQLENSNEYLTILNSLKKLGIVLLGDSTANASNQVIQNHDLILANDKILENLKSDIVIHIGKSHVSKRIKQFFRKCSPRQNWLIKKGDKGAIIDTYQSLTHILDIDAILFLKIFHAFLSQKNHSIVYLAVWEEYAKEVSERQNLFINTNKNWNELGAIQKVLHSISSQKNEIHFGNSLSIRYSNWLPFFPKGLVYCNRGTSGIDGSVSTYVAATSTLEINSFLVIGDLSFHYDQNGLWNEYLNQHQRIIVLNNSGGGIFRNLEGAKDLPELEKFIATKQNNTAEFIAKNAGLLYFKAENYTELQNSLHVIQEKSNLPILLEIVTDPDNNKEIISNYMGLFKS
ncbi:MAG: 2-succinyl-5-enolpyruvyl-6-hydroxy-3-cyclohexene-carboxylic-acidynthase [Bacteroidota bacterium]